MRQRGRVDRKAIDGSNACKTSKFVVFSSLLSRACATCQTRAPRSRSLRTRLLLFNDIPSESITAGERRERPSFLRVEKWFRSDFFSRGQSRGKIFVRSSSSFSQPRPPLFLSLFSPFSLLPMLAPLLGLLQFSVRREMGMVVHSFFFFFFLLRLPVISQPTSEKKQSITLNYPPSPSPSSALAHRTLAPTAAASRFRATS